MNQKEIIEKIITIKCEIERFFHKMKSFIQILFDKEVWIEIRHGIMLELYHCREIIQVIGIKEFFKPILIGAFFGFITSKIFIWIIGDLGFW